MAFVSALTLPGCTPRPNAAPRPTAPHVAWSYDVTAHGVQELDVEARFDAIAPPGLGVDDTALPFVRDVSLAGSAGATPVARRGSTWSVPCARGCTVRYRFELEAAAREIATPDTAIASGDVVIAPPSTWLLHPASADDAARFRFHVAAGPGSRFVTGVHPAPDGSPDAFEADAADMDGASFAAFGPLHVSRVAAGDATIQVGIAPHALALSDSDVLAWVRASAGAVASYYLGHPPARRALVLMMEGNAGPTRGLTLGGGGPATLVRVGQSVTAASTRDDWVVTHELLHVNFPDPGWQHAWLTEGLATYVEPIARARAGLVDPAKVWRDLVDGLPQGLPGPGDEGLEKTRTWGRTYWGGALFCLLADVGIRERTGNTRSLDSALRAIGATGATDEIYWDISRILDVGDAATGTRVLHDVYARLALAPGSEDLDALFAKLGVRPAGKSVAFDDSAPLASIRTAITARSAN